MNIDMNKLSSMLFNSSESSEFIRQLNRMLKYMIDRDCRYVASDSSAPKIWECRWLNSSRTLGYPKGYTVWMNTDTYEHILGSNSMTIESYVANNPTLNTMYNAIDPADTTARNKFLLEAAMGTASNNVSAIYCLGDVSEKVQIRVSKIDNNKSYPTDMRYWDDFFIRQTMEDNVSMLLSGAEVQMQEAVEEHLSLYHKIGINEFTLNADGFFPKDPFDLSNIQTQDFFDHTYCDEMRGFDFVKQWKMKSDGSQWCKVWNSGYVEQGGFVENIQGLALIPVEFMTTYNYPLGASFYQRDYQTYAGVYAVDTSIQANNRYIATVTPILSPTASPYPRRPVNVENELLYATSDITDMSNRGFSIVNIDLSKERYSRYSWHTCGYKVLTADSQMFDGKTTSSISPRTAFSISNGVLNYFNNSAGYVTVVVPDGVTSLANRTFFCNQTAKSISLPNSLTSFGLSSFAGCMKLRGIVIPDGVTDIPAEEFLSCPSLSYVKMGTGVTTIGGGAFSQCTNLATVTRFNDDDPGHTFDKVGNYAFYNTKLKRINLSLRSAGIDNFWGDYCFQNCKSLEEVNILSACYMSTRMFKDCTALKTVNFKNNHTSYVYPGVFDGCKSLTSIMLPSKIWYISEEMFKDCIGLKNVRFNSYEASDSAINLIQKNAFNGCSSMRSLEIPASLTSLTQLEDACLSNCALTSITFHGILSSSIVNQDGSIVDMLRSNSMYRLNHDCEIISKEGATIKFKYVAGEADAYVAPYDYYMSKVNMTETKTFFTARDTRNGGRYWYYNAKQLCPYAKNQNTPVLAIYSLLGCKPCQVYMEKVFNNAGFQSWAAKQKFFLCSMEVNQQPSLNDQLNYCVNTLTPKAWNFAKEDLGQTLNDVVPNALGRKFRRWRVDANLLNSNLTTPVLVFYYYNGSQEKTYVHTFHNIDKEIDSWGLDKVIKCVKSLCLYYFDNNSKQNARFVVDADEFDASDYPLENEVAPTQPDNPYIVIPTSDQGQTLMSINDVNKYICAKIGPDCVSNGIPYMMNCTFDDVPFLSRTFPGINELMSISEVNALVNRGNNAKYVFQIGSNYYKFSLSATNTKKIPSRCVAGISSLTAGAVLWTLTSAPA